MFKITLINLAKDATQASRDLGRQNLGDVPPAETRLLLERFQGLDFIQNFEADPEILLETRRYKRVVRVNHGKLCLYNPGNHLESGLQLTPDEIIAELDGSTAARSARSLFAEPPSPLLALRREPATPGLTLPLRPRLRASLAALALGLAGYLAYAALSAEPASAAERFEPLIESKQNESLLTNLVGVYMTGNRPGDHGLVLDAGGALKLFELNSLGAPSLIRDTYRVGRIDGMLCGLCNQPGGPIWMNGRDTLTYCGETYRRLP
jgi:hypothetical protein